MDNFGSGAYISFASDLVKLLVGMCLSRRKYSQSEQLYVVCAP